MNPKITDATGTPVGLKFEITPMGYLHQVASIELLVQTSHRL